MDLLHQTAQGPTHLLWSAALHDPFHPTHLPRTQTLQHQQGVAGVPGVLAANCPAALWLRRQPFPLPQLVQFLGQNHHGLVNSSGTVLPGLGDQAQVQGLVQEPGGPFGQLVVQQVVGGIQEALLEVLGLIHPLGEGKDRVPLEQRWWSLP